MPRIRRFPRGIAGWFPDDANGYVSTIVFSFPRATKPHFAPHRAPGLGLCPGLACQGTVVIRVLVS